MKSADFALTAIVIFTIVVIATTAKPVSSFNELDDALFTEVVRELERQNNWEPPN
jgi:hypothetical protein